MVQNDIDPTSNSCLQRSFSSWHTYQISIFDCYLQLWYSHVGFYYTIIDVLFKKLFKKYWNSNTTSWSFLKAWLIKHMIGTNYWSRIRDKYVYEEPLVGQNFWFFKYKFLSPKVASYAPNMSSEIRFRLIGHKPMNGNDVHTCTTTIIRLQLSHMAKNHFNFVMMCIPWFFCCVFSPSLC